MLINVDVKGTQMLVLMSSSKYVRCFLWSDTLPFQIFSGSKVYHAICQRSVKGVNYLHKGRLPPPEEGFGAHVSERQQRTCG